MSDGQVLALMSMYVLGHLGLIVFTGTKRKAWQIAGLAWAAVWWLPPFVVVCTKIVAVWIKGVFG